jgi:hypothetical protein
MERQDDIIIFNETEQTRFNVPARTTPQDAIEIADGYMNAAMVVEDLASQERQQPPINSTTDGELEKRFTRAYELLRFSRSIYAHCAPEIINSLTEDPSPNEPN